MKKFLCVVVLVCVLFITGCDNSRISNSEIQNDSSSTTFVNGMGCSDHNCTDSSHHHDCPQDCDNYDHHHNCSLDCTEASHYHNNTNVDNNIGKHHQEEQHNGNHH